MLLLRRCGRAFRRRRNPFTDRRLGTAARSGDLLEIERIEVAPQVDHHSARDHESLPVEQGLPRGRVDIEVELRGVITVAVLAQHIRVIGHVHRHREIDDVHVA